MSGKGYVGLVYEAMKKIYGDRVSSVNLGINGQTSADLVKQIRQPEVRQLLKRATWITITIGGNDLFRASGGPEQVDRVAIDEGRASYRKNLSRIMKEIRELNDEAPIFVYGLYNPFGDLSGQGETSRLVMEWNRQSTKSPVNSPGLWWCPPSTCFNSTRPDTCTATTFIPTKRGTGKWPNAFFMPWENRKGRGDRT